MTSLSVGVCVLWRKVSISSIQPSLWRLLIVCGERSKAELMSRGQVASSFRGVLPFSPNSPNSHHPSVRPSRSWVDQGPELAPTSSHRTAFTMLVGEGLELDKPKSSTKVSRAGKCSSRVYNPNADGNWQQTLVIVFRSLPSIKQELLQGAVRWLDRVHRLTVAVR